VDLCAHRGLDWLASGPGERSVIREVNLEGKEAQDASVEAALNFHVSCHLE
jgi:hypothetical protein